MRMNEEDGKKLMAAMDAMRDLEAELRTTTKGCVKTRRTLWLQSPANAPSSKSLLHLTMK